MVIENNLPRLWRSLVGSSHGNDKKKVEFDSSASFEIVPRLEKFSGYRPGLQELNLTFTFRSSATEPFVM